MESQDHSLEILAEILQGMARDSIIQTQGLDPSEKITIEFSPTGQPKLVYSPRYILSPIKWQRC